MTGWRLDQPAKPDARTKYELGVARLVAARTRPECRQHGAVAAILTDLKIGKPHLGQGATQFMQWRDHWVCAGHLPECVVAEIKPPAVEPWPWNVVARKQFRKTVRLEGSPLKDAVVTVHLGDKLILNVGPMMP